MPYQEIQALGFPNSPRKLGLYEKPRACISWYGPCTQLVNSKYNILVTRDISSVDHSYRQKWANTLGFVNWGKVFKSIQKSNVDRKANDLRWKILHRCTLTARRLAGKSPLFDSSICKVCEHYEENLTHLFYLCSSEKRFGIMSTL